MGDNQSVSCVARTRIFSVQSLFKPVRTLYVLLCIRREVNGFVAVNCRFNQMLYSRFNKTFHSRFNTQRIHIEEVLFPGGL